MIKVIIKTDSIKVKRARLTAGQHGVVARPDGTIKAEFGERLAFHGAIDIQHTLPRGTPAEVQAEVRERCQVLGVGGGYICTSAHYLQADTPLENIVAMYTEPRELDPA